MYKTTLRKHGFPLTLLVVLTGSLFIISSCGGGGGGGASGGGTTTGKNSILYSVLNSAPTSSCPNGGITVYAGIDTNSNGVLDPSEITSTQYVCNGANGTNGLTVLVSVTDEPSGTNCSSGGKKVSVGLDANGNGVLDVSEITSSNYICNGANGTNGINGLTMLVSIVSEPSGTNCANGGTKVASGLDVNNNNILDAGEVTSTTYVCNGATGPTMPVIQSLYLTGAPANPGGTITATVNAQSAQNLALTYSWSVSGGWTIASGATTNTATITAPNSYAAAGKATVTVTDSQSRSAVGTIALSTVGDSAPVIESISIYPQPVITSATLVASAYDANGDPLTYSWTIGGIINILTGSSAIWSSPGIPGYYTVGLTVSDGTTTVSGSSYVSVDSASPWPRFRRVIQGTGVSPIDTSGNTGLVTKWNYITGFFVDSSPAVGADGTVYVGSYDNKLYAINPDGTLKWSFTTGGTVNSSPTIGADGTVYVGSNDTKLYAVNPDGTQKWSFTTGGGIYYSSPAIGADGTVYVGSLDGKLYAIDRDGTRKWSYTTGNWAESSPAIGMDGTVYVGSEDNKLYAINPDGTLKWSFTTGGGVYSSPAIGEDGTVYVGSEDNKLYAINRDGTQKWSYTTGNRVLSSPAIGADGTVYVGSEDYKLYAVNPNGTQKWSYTTGNRVSSSPAIGADGTVYVGSWDGELYAINPNGTQKWSHVIGGYILSSPAIGADGTVYVGSYDENKLCAIK